MHFNLSLPLPVGSTVEVYSLRCESLGSARLIECSSNAWQLLDGADVSLRQPSLLRGRGALVELQLSGSEAHQHEAEWQTACIPGKCFVLVHCRSIAAPAGLHAACLAAFCKL
jgi:hypothetical protein